MMGNWITGEGREAQIAAAKADVEAQITESRERAHRALDCKYNLLRVSERRWRVVRIAQTAKKVRQDVDVEDVIIFEQVTEPLAWDAAVMALQRKREGK